MFEMNSKFIVYQVFTRLFGNDKKTRKPNGSITENGCGKFNDFTPIALKAIKDLGVTHVWFTGVMEHATKTDYTSFGIEKNNESVVKGNAGSPYAIRDYYDVCPDLAVNVENRMKEFEELIKRTHKAGLKVIIDFVPNHVAREYKSDKKPRGVKDLGEGDDVNLFFHNQNNFYYIAYPFMPQFEMNCPYNEFPAKATGNNRFDASPTINDWYETVKLNYGVDFSDGRVVNRFDPMPNTWTKMRDILMFWSKKGVDGFRCDMAEMVPVDFWHWVIPEVKREFKNLIFIAEVYNPNEYRNYIQYGNFDYLYDKVGLYDQLKAVTAGYSASSLTHCWQSINDIQGNMLNFLENHDEQRLASDFFANDGKNGIPALVVSACMNTNPFMLYFGQELGEKGMDEEGFSGKDGRTTIFDYWSLKSIQNWRNGGSYDGGKLTKTQKDLQQVYKTVLNCALNEKAISEGLFYDIMYANYDNADFDGNKVYAFIRKYKNEVIVALANFSDEKMKVKVHIPSEAFDYLELKPNTSVTPTDLISGKKESKINLSPDENFAVSLDKKGAKLLKFILK